MDKEKAEAAFEAWLKESNLQEQMHQRQTWLAAWDHREAELGKLQAELDWHKRELARLDHELVDKCDEVNRLQAELSELRSLAEIDKGLYHS